MALVLKDRVKETTTTTGTGTITLGGAVANFQAFSSIGDGNTTYYVIEDTVNNAWEVGVGTYTLAGTTLARNTVLANSLGTTALITFAAGTKNVFCNYPASKSFYTDLLGTNVLTALGTAVGSAGAVVVNGGVLGTPSSGTLTNCTFPTLNQNTSGTAAGLSTTLVATSGGTGTATTAIGDLLQGAATNTWSKLASVATGNALISGGVTTASSWGKIGLTTHVSGTLPIGNGGTNLTAYTTGDIVYASATNTLASLADVATGNALISGGVGVVPSYGKVGLTTHVSGTLPIANGGTNATATPTLGGVIVGTGTAYSSTAAGTSGQSFISNGGAAPTWQDLTLMNLAGAWVKKAVDCATTAALTLNTAQTTIDGVTLTVNSRVLVKNQATASQNGIYTAMTTTTWIRAVDADTSSEIAGGTVSIDAGTTNFGEIWSTSFKSTDTIGTTAMNWYRVFDSSQTLSVANGGTGATTLTGIIKGTGTTAIVAATAGTDFVAPATATNFTAQQYFGTATLTDGATVSWAANTQQVAKVTIAGNRTMAAPTGLVDGGFYSLLVIQDATGSRTLTWNAVFDWAGGTAPTLSTAASAKDIFVFRSDGTNLLEVGRSLGVV